MSRRDFYEVLGVPRDVDMVRLKRAYRELAMRYHPDQNPDNVEAEARFKEVSEAYTVLSDPEARARYDRRGFAGVDGGFPFDATSFTELFENVFGDLFGKKKKQPGRDLRYNLELSFEEAALGCKKTIRFPSRVDCKDCRGSGQKGGPEAMLTCSACAGKGDIKVQQGFFSLGKKCATCGGSGKTVGEACPGCRGAGNVEVEREYEVSIPPGTDEGSTRRVAGEGESGRGGGSAGDLNVLIKVKPHAIFRREGEAIVCDVPVSAVDAALGCVIPVPTLDGSVEMRVPAGTQAGTLFRLREKGIPRVGGKRGDQHVKLAVETPVKLSDKQRALLSELRLSAEQTPTVTKFRDKR